ncbi:hypothetical protein Pcinc_029815 [Petrolisthes cinctipes]|uniref:Uncharacterized protein n=1 Tax=Petrolisthes cinctipes TaxID=88211 RepID=A0AAE1EZA7_PETCI|nr:hypothetical protein Pcinc_029815 [Petrolisthes cinctipes]
MHLGHGNESHQYVMNGVNLEASEHEKDLGVMVDDKLRFHLHTAQVVAKALRGLGMIRRSFENLNRKTIPLLFKSIIRPILEYGNCVWGPLFQGPGESGPGCNGKGFKACYQIGPGFTRTAI